MHNALCRRTRAAGASPSHPLPKPPIAAKAGQQPELASACLKQQLASSGAPPITVGAPVMTVQLYFDRPVIGVDNIWIHPLNGSVGRQITNFKSDEIVEFHWSPDGKTLGMLRNHTDSDVVLIQDQGSSSQ
jgi:hypothetical protein